MTAAFFLDWLRLFLELFLGWLIVWAVWSALDGHL